MPGRSRVPAPMPVRQQPAGARVADARAVDEMAQDGRAGRRDALAGDAVVAPAKAVEQRAVAGAGTGSMPCARAHGPPPSGRADTLQRAPSSAAAMQPAATTSISESQSPISWKCTSSSGDAMDRGFGLRQDGAGSRRACSAVPSLSGAARMRVDHVAVRLPACVVRA